MVTALLIAGTLYSLWTLRKTDQEMRKNLLVRTRFIAMGLNTESVKRLSGTEADLKKQQYHQLKEQLFTLKRANKDIREIYLMGLKPDETIFFYIDAERPNSPSSVGPGYPYKDATVALRHSLEQWTELIEGPEKDQWGVWISARVPIKDMLTGAPIAMLGTDVAYSTWNFQLILSVIPTIIVTLFLIFVTLISGFLMRRRHILGSTAPRWMDYLASMLIAIFGIVFSSFVSWRIYENKVLLRNETFTQLAIRNTDIIIKGLNYIRFSELEGLTGFFQHSSIVDQNEFNIYTRHLVKNSLVLTWGWIPVVPGKEKKIFEEKMRQNGFPDFYIWQFGKNGKPEPATERDVYYPIIYYAPEPGNENIRGFDLGSESKRLDAIKAATRMNLPIASESVTLVQDTGTSKKKGIDIFSPVADLKDPKTLRGFTVAAIRIETLLGSSHRAYEMIQMTLSSIYSDSSTKILASFGEISNDAEAISVVRPLFIFGKVFIITVHPSRAFMRIYPVYEWWFSFLAGLCLTAAITTISFLILRRRSELENLVNERTAKLSESEKKYRLLFENMMGGFALHEMLYDKNGKAYDYRFIEVNPAFERLTGLKAEKIVGRTVLEVLPETEPYWIEMYDKVIQTGSGCAYRRRSGALDRIYDVCAFKTQGTFFATIFTDVTNKVKMEEELTSYFNTSIDLFCLTDLHGCFIKLNPQWKEELGYEMSELVGNKVVKFVHPDDRKASLEAIARLSSDGMVVGFVNRYRHKNGSYRWIEWRTTSNGRIIYAAARDITDRKNKELELLEINRTLTQSEERATLMAKQAEAANIAKSEFLANMSHEIRTPMNAVIGMTGLLVDMNLTPEQRQYVEIVHHSGTALLNLLNDILDYSKMEAGKLEFDLVDFDLIRLMDELVETMDISASQKDLELICQIDPDVPPWLHGDPGRLRQILVNLVGNAIKFTNVGEVFIRVRLEASKPEDHEPHPDPKKKVMLRFSIRDTGIGIPENKIGGLFNVFTQVDSTITRRFGGTGLGLSISKQLAGMMGGSIGVKSELGKGSEFWVTVQLPLSASGKMSCNGFPSDFLRDIHVLIVDDNSTSCKVMSEQLCFFGMRVEYEKDWTRALEKLNQALESSDPFEVMVADMRIQDHIDSIRKIKKIPRMADLTIVLLTSPKRIPNPLPPDGIDFSACLNKPLRHQALAKAISKILKEKAVSQMEYPVQNNTDISIGTDLSAIANLASSLSKTGSRILLVEDIVTNQLVAIAMLKKLGLHADAVSNGKEALLALESTPYDLVLMDLQMPEMDGYETTRQIRQPHSIARNHEIPIIAMTAHAMQSDREHCLEAGMNDFLSKPILLSVLAKVLGKWLLRDSKNQ